ncbi:hypothetical protein ZHAS_00001166 [Anopheles sinensis]|uniref:Uncharacterized protein n=1 Tax=Anopheles sinensis TaxID=74873 RepID=A0A084VB35_ANOSI|nr:hypothetical protein ZHAS_00001166 [Anopheles sinensis]
MVAPFGGWLSGRVRSGVAVFLVCFNKLRTYRKENVLELIFLFPFSASSRGAAIDSRPEPPSAVFVYVFIFIFTIILLHYSAFY